MRRIDAIEPELLKSISHHSTRRFCGVSVTPEGYADPVTQFGAPVLVVRIKSDSTAQATTAAQPNCQAQFILFRRTGQKLTSILLFVWMRDAKGGDRNLTCA